MMETNLQNKIIFTQDSYKPIKIEDLSIGKEMQLYKHQKTKSYWKEYILHIVPFFI
jgi:hypothetical protein